MIGVADCDNFFCSCERVSHPELNGRAIVVLSNNDGCIVSRSAEAKALGVKMGLPYFKMKEQFPKGQVLALSSNYKLYRELSSKVMDILRETAPGVVQYSVDEAFMDLHGMDRFDLKLWGESLSRKILSEVGIPVSIGIASSKTLAKLASRFAKKYPGYRKCCMIATPEQREKALRLCQVEDVWGIGRRLSDSLHKLGVHTAYDYSQISREAVQARFKITGLRTWRELRGEDCIPTEDKSQGKKSIMTSRSFPQMISDLDTLRVHVSNYASSCAKRLREQGSVCSTVTTFVHTNRFRQDLTQYEGLGSVKFPTPTSTIPEIVSAATKTLSEIYKEGCMYKKAGVIVSDISDGGAVEMDLFTFNPEKRRKLDDISDMMDSINHRLGEGTVVLAQQKSGDTAPDHDVISFGG